MPVAPVSLPLTKRLTVFILASLLFLFHLTLASRLSSFSNSLRSVLGSPGDDQDLEGGEGGRLYGIITLVRIGRLWSLCSAGIALTGIYSIYKTNLPLLRLFTLNSFLSLALDFLLLLLILILILASASSSSSSRSVATTLCQTLSTSNSPTSDELSWWGLPDLLGLSLEACEERFEGLVMSGLIVLGAVEGLRGAAAIQLLSYYTMVAKRRNGISNNGAMGGSGRRSGRGSGLRVETGGGGGGGRSGKEGDAGERYYDSPVQEVELASTSPSTSKGKGRERERENSSSSKRGGDDTRIFLLPSRSRSDGDGKGKGKEVDQGNEVPLLSLTPSTPNRTTFPPQSIVSPRTERGSNSRSQTLPVGPKVLVYQPVMMTVEEARQYGASELLLHSSHPKRSRSHSSSASQHHRPSSHSHSHSHSSSDRRNRSSTITPSSSHASPPKSSSSSSRGTTLLDLMETSTSPTPTEDSMMSDDLPTPKGEIGLAGLLRGDLEDEREHVKRA